MDEHTISRILIYTGRSRWNPPVLVLDMKTAPTLGPTPLIPQPQHGIDRSYISALRPADRLAFAAAKTMIRELLPERLDLALSWSLQSKEAIKSLVDKIAQSYPSFRAHYEGAWPLFYYAQQHLTRLRSERRARERQMNRTRGPRRHAAQKSAHLPPQGNQQPSVAVATTVHRRIDGSCNNGGPQVSPRSGDAARFSSSEFAAARVVMIERLVHGDSEVLNFLVSTHSSLGYLLDRCRSAGITCEARLLVIAGWTATQRDMFLKNELRLSALERQMLEAGLMRLAMGKHGVLSL